jgi:hypothetical protein
VWGVQHVWEKGTQDFSQKIIKGQHNLGVRHRYKNNIEMDIKSDVTWTEFI